MWELTPKQKELLDAISSEKYSFILFGGAVGGAKTIGSLSALLVMCSVFKGSRWLVIRENTEKIRTTTIPSFKKIPKSGRLYENPYVYKHPNGSEILFKGENYDQDKDLDWLKGFEVSGVLFEEINECQEATFNKAFERIGRWESNPRPKPIILATCNPTQNWVKYRVYDHYKNGTLKPTWLYIPSRVFDNPHLTQDYLESLKELPPYEYEVFVNGNWDVSIKKGMEFYKQFDINKHTGPTFYDPELPLHISFDENVQPYMPATTYQIKGKKIMLIDEFATRNPNNNLEGVCSEIKKKYYGHKSGMFVYGDATSQKEDAKLQKGHNFFRIILELLKDFKPQLRVPSSNPSVVMRGNFINQVFFNNYDSIEVIIGSHCTMTITDFMNVKEASDGSKDKKAVKGVQEYGHLSDSFDYIMTRAFAESYAKYQAGTAARLPQSGKFVSKNTY